MAAFRIPDPSVNSLSKGRAAAFAVPSVKQVVIDKRLNATIDKGRATQVLARPARRTIPQATRVTKSPLPQAYDTRGRKV